MRACCARSLLRNHLRAACYKGGQLLFELMEREDFMVDGSAPPFLGPTTARFSKQAEVHFDLGPNRDRLAVFRGGPKPPLGNRFDCPLIQARI
jgi:hypothetical protein